MNFVVIEYQAEVFEDDKGSRYTAEFPEHVKKYVQYGLTRVYRIQNGIALIILCLFPNAEKDSCMERLESSWVQYFMS